MIKLRKKSLASTPFFASFIVILILGIFIALYWGIHEYHTYLDGIANIRTTYQDQYRQQVKKELSNIISFIDFERNQTARRTEEEIREKVQAAFTIASHLFQIHRDTTPIDTLRSKVSEMLRPIRWQNGQGYYFAGRIDTRQIDLFADEPFFEGKTRLASPDPDSPLVIEDITRLVKKKGAAVYQFILSKPAFPGMEYSTISFVKYFKPFNWFLGAAAYTDDIERVLQASVLDRVHKLTFGEDGEILVFRFDGTIISSRQKQMIGRSISSLSSNTAPHSGQAMLDAGKENPRGRFIHLSPPASSPETSAQKLTFVRPYGDWGWIFAATMSMTTMKKAVAEETANFKSTTLQHVTTFLFLLACAISLLLLATFYFSSRIKQELGLFTAFFRQAKDQQVKIDNDLHAFIEFEELGNLVNHMVDDRIQKEHTLRRNELRLDTLLQLGMMEKCSLQEKYDFTLQRIVRITRSREGYLALVNANQSHLTLCSYVSENKLSVTEKIETTRITSTVDNGGLPGTAIKQQATVTCNDCQGLQKHATYPYQDPIQRHLDVPIFNDGKIVIVAGVCNNSSQYDNSDIRQITMLLEGMWLHVLKTCSEEEMSRLERQIIAVSEAERSNIGRDLHDDLGSHLSGVELLSKALQQRLKGDTPAGAAQLGTIRNLIREAIEKTRRLSQGLYPVHVIEHGLEAAIEELAAEVQDLFKLRCLLEITNHIEWTDNNVAPHVYYIIREAVFNAARHGRPDTISIIIKKNESLLLVDVIDNGSGFTITNNKKGMGFHTMHYRARAIGSSLTIKSGEDSGTIISLCGEVLK